MICISPVKGLTRAHFEQRHTTGGKEEKRFSFSFCVAFLKAQLCTI